MCELMTIGAAILFTALAAFARRAGRPARALGTSDECDPLILLSFLALPVIPEVRLTDCGLFDVTTMSFLYQN